MIEKIEKNNNLIFLKLALEVYDNFLTFAQRQHKFLLNNNTDFDFIFNISNNIFRNDTEV